MSLKDKVVCFFNDGSGHNMMVTNSKLSVNNLIHLQLSINIDSLLNKQKCNHYSFPMIVWY